MLAPGSEITAAGLTFSGTSQASPHVAGAVAVLRAAFPSDSLRDTVERLAGNGTNVVDHGNDLPKPRLNLQASVGSPTWRCTSKTVTLNSGVDGTLLSGTCHAYDNDDQLATYYADVYEFNGTSGQQIDVDLSSSQFDTYVSLQTPSDTVAAYNDDSGGGTDSHLSYTLTASGTWAIVVSSFAPYETGHYHLSVTPTGSSGGGGGGSSCRPSLNEFVSVIE